METTNTLFVISNYARGEIGYLFLWYAILLVFYTLTSIEFKRRKITKMKQAVDLIKKGHYKIEKARKNGELQ